MQSLNLVLLIVLCLGSAATRGVAGDKPAPAYSVERGVNQLAAPDLAVRQQAVWDLGNAADEAGAAVPALVDLLGHDDDQLRWSAAWALWQIGEKSCVPVAARLRDGDVRVRRTASYVLHKLTPTSLEAQRLLLPAAADSDQLVRQHAYTAISFLSPERAKQLTAERHALRVALIHGAEPPKQPFDNMHYYKRIFGMLRSQLGPIEPAEAPALTALLASESPTTCIVSCLALEELGPAAHEASAELASLLDDDSLVGEAALAALTAIGPQSKVAAPQLIKRIERLRSRSKNFRKEIALLVQWQADAKAAVPVLLKIVKQLESREIRSKHLGHIEAVAAIGRIATEVPPELLQQLSDSSAEVRRVAAEAIAGFGSRGAPAVPRLVAMLYDYDEFSAHAALVAIEQIGPAASEAIPVLAHIVRLNSTDWIKFIRKYFNIPQSSQYFYPRPVQVLGKLGPQALPILLEFLSHESPQVRNDAAIGLGHLGSAASEELKEKIVPALIKATSDKDLSTARSAIDSLGALKTAARPSIDTLIEKMTTSNDSDRFHGILTALVRIDPQDARVHAALHVAGSAFKNYQHQKTALMVLLEAGQATDQDLEKYFDLGSLTAEYVAQSPIYQKLASTHLPLLLSSLNDRGGRWRRIAAAHVLRYADFDRHPEVLDALARVCGSNPAARNSLFDLSGQGFGILNRRAVLPLVRQLRSESEACRSTALKELETFLTSLRPNERAEIDRLIADPPAHCVETAIRLEIRTNYHLICSRPRPYDELVHLAMSTSRYDVSCELAEYGAAAVPALRRTSLLTIGRLKCQGIEALPALERFQADVTNPELLRAKIGISVKWLSLDSFPMVPQRKQ